MLRGLLASLIVVSLCVVIHVCGLLLLADWLLRHPVKQEPQFNIRRYSSLFISVFAVITLLHLLETFVWGGLYYWWGHFGDFETCWYFSLSSYTTIGYGDVVLPVNWRLIGGIEGISGVLLCGLAAAFLFGLVYNMLESREKLRDELSTSAVETATR